MTSDFKEFKLDNSSNNTWDEHTAMASAAVSSFFSKINVVNCFDAFLKPDFKYPAGISCDRRKCSARTFNFQVKV